MSEEVKVTFENAKVLKINPKSKYLMIFPVGADLVKIAPALQAFFSPTTLFVLGAQDVNSLKITELIESSKKKGGR